MEIAACKLLLTPALLALATLAGRRFGERAAGWLAGLPLTSGPVSVFLTLEQGRAFAARAASGTLLGLVSVAAFSAAYALAAARGAGWRASTSLGALAFLGATSALARVPAGAPLAFSLALAAATLALCLVGRPRGARARTAATRWDLPLRALVATALVLALTAAARRLGPALAGLLSPFPAFVGVLTVFAHVQRGERAARDVLAGALAGSYAFAAFPGRRPRPRAPGRAGGLRPGRARGPLPRRRRARSARAGRGAPRRLLGSRRARPPGPRCP
jgi:hypothetical protein